jgi:hypothetical protein
LQRHPPLSLLPLTRRQLNPPGVLNLYEIDPLYRRIARLAFRQLMLRTEVMRMLKSARVLQLFTNAALAEGPALALEVAATRRTRARARQRRFTICSFERGRATVAT